MELRLKFRTDETARAFSKLGKRTVPWAAARALTETAVQLRDVTVARLAGQFKIRSRWVPDAIRSTGATHTKLRSLVWVRDKTAEFMSRQALGGTKPVGSKGEQGVPQKGGPQLGVEAPRGAAGERKTLRGSNWPGKLLDRVTAALERRKAARAAGSKRKSRSKWIKSGVFVIDKPDMAAIMQRLSPGRGRGHYRMLWYIQKGPVNIPKRWDFYPYGQRFVPRVYPKLFDMAMAEEMAGFKP